MSKKQIVVIGLSILYIQFTSTGCRPAQNRYCVANFDNDRAVEYFAAKFKSAVISNKKAEVATMIKYPLRATIRGADIMINGEAAFLSLYDSIFTTEFIRKLAGFSTHNMWANYQGVMLGDGDVWFGASCTDCKDIKIISVGVCRRIHSTAR